MTTQKTSRTQPMVLTNAQIKKCNEIKDSQQGLAQKRAITLLLIHVGNSYSQAAEQSGLTLGQVRYLVTAFRRRGLSLFDTESKPTTSKTVTKKSPTKKTATKKAPKAKTVPNKTVVAKPAAEKVETKVAVVASENSKEENEKTSKKDKKKLKKIKDKTAKKDKKDKKDKKKGKKKKSK